MPAALTPPDEQPLLGLRTNDEWDALLAEVNAQVQAVEAWPDAAARQQVLELLNGVDAIHREALHRLVRLFKEGVLEQVVTDPAIHTLMELYDLLPAPRPAAPGAPASRTIIPIRAVRAAPPARHPHWVPALSQHDLAAGELPADRVVDGVPLLIARRVDEWFAVDAACPLDGSSLRGASANGYTLSCPNHAGCHYDLRGGARLGGGPSLGCHPVRVDERGRVLVGLGIRIEPSLPSC